ncbi:MAG: hypothetical protein ACF8GE_04280 [Phycisphaerales bacterium JB043]
MDDPLSTIDTRDATVVGEAFDRAARTNLEASCRRGSIDLVPLRGTLHATGDIHDNPLNLARVLQLARLDEHTDDRPRHVIFHEVIHPDQLVGGVDHSWRSLLRIAALKTRHPESVHTLLANHELAQIVGSGIVKDGVRVVDAFNEGIEASFFDESARVQEAIEGFIRSMPLALRCGEWDEPGVVCAHSLPGDSVMERFDETVLERELVEEDYEPRKGAAHLMVWGRHHSPELLERLGERWGAALFVLGHQKAETGAMLEPPNAIVLNSDHTRGVVLPIDLGDLPEAQEAVWSTVPLQTIS